MEYSQADVDRILKASEKELWAPDFMADLPVWEERAILAEEVKRLRAKVKLLTNFFKL